jgi:hypothetical protein
VTLGDADFRKFLMKMIYRKFPKTASLPVHLSPSDENGPILLALFDSI